MCGNYNLYAPLRSWVSSWRSKQGLAGFFLHFRYSDDKLINTTLMALFGISGNFNLRTDPRVVLVIAPGTPKTQQSNLFWKFLKYPHLDLGMWDQLTRQNWMVTNNHDPWISTQLMNWVDNCPNEINAFVIKF